MKWEADGVMLGAHGFGEHGAVAELFTRSHGRVGGLVRGAKAQRLRSLLQPGQLVHARWRARLEEHLGSYQLEPARASHPLEQWFAHYASLLGVQSLCLLLRCLPEREAHQRLYDAAQSLLPQFGAPSMWPADLARFEMLFLQETGFGLDVTRCARTGAKEGLAYVSPRSGRAVTPAGAGRWRDRLLPLPAFLLPQKDKQKETRPSPDALAQAFALTGHFLAQRVFAEQGQANRSRFLQLRRDLLSALRLPALRLPALRLPALNLPATALTPSVPE